MNRVAVLVLNDYTNDSRVIKEVNSLAKKYKVDVFAVNTGNYENVEHISDRITIYRNIKYFKPENKFLKKISQLYVYSKFFISTLSKLKSYDIVHCNDLETLPIGILAKKIFGNKLKVIYDAHEYETETLWMKNRYKKKMAKLLEGALIRYADKVICVSDAIANEYVKDYNIKKPELVLNTPPFKRIEKKNIFRETFDISKEKTIFLYQGGLSRGRGIEILLDTFKTIDTNNAVIVFMGYGPLEDEIKKATKEHKNIYFHKAVNPAILLNYTSSADFGILFYENNCLNHNFCSPNKMFEYLMAEIPVIASNLYEMKKLVESNKIGIVAKENSPDGLKDAIKRAIKLDKEKLKENIQKVKEVYNWEEQEKVLLKLYGELKDD